MSHAIWSGSAISQVLQNGRSFNHNGKSFPPNFLAVAKEDVKFANNIYPLSVVKPPLDLFQRYGAINDALSGNIITRTYQVLDFDLARTKEEAKKLINQWRDKRENDPFEYNSNWFDGNAASKNKINGAATLAITNESFTIEWTAADNSQVSLDNTGMIALGAAVASRDMTLHANAKAAKSSIEAAVNVMEIRTLFNGFRESNKNNKIISQTDYDNMVSSPNYVADVTVNWVVF